MDDRTTEEQTRTAAIYCISRAVPFTPNAHQLAHQ